jgi:hypothetical protein
VKEKEREKKFTKTSKNAEEKIKSKIHEAINFYTEHFLHKTTHTCDRRVQQKNTKVLEN